MKRNILFAALFATAALFNACQTEEVVPAPAPAEDERLGGYFTRDTLTGEPNCQPKLTNLYAGKHTLIGDVVTWNDSSNIYVTITTKDGWVLRESHVYAGPLTKLPATSKGNPKNGNFPYKATHQAGTTTYTYTIPLSAAGNHDCIAIATHAAVNLIGPNGEDLRGETAWGEGTRLAPKGNWSMYFTYCICGDGSNGGGSGNGGNEGN